MYADFGFLKNADVNATEVVIEVSFMTVTSLPLGIKTVRCGIGALEEQVLSFTAINWTDPKNLVLLKL